MPYFERALAAGQRSSMLLNGLALARLEVGRPRRRRGRVPGVPAPRPPPARRREGSRGPGGPASLRRSWRGSRLELVSAVRRRLDLEGLARLRRPGRRRGRSRPGSARSGPAGAPSRGSAQGAGEGAVGAGLERRLRGRGQEAPVAAADREARGDVRGARGRVLRGAEDLEVAVEQARGGERRGARWARGAAAPPPLVVAQAVAQDRRGDAEARRRRPPRSRG